MVKDLKKDRRKRWIWWSEDKDGMKIIMLRVNLDLEGKEY